MTTENHDHRTATLPGLHDQDLLIAILESIGDGFVAVDGAWRFTYVNRQAEELLGRSLGELLGLPLWEAFPDLEGTIFGREFLHAAERGNEVAFEAFYPPLDKWFEVRAFPFRGGLSILFQDISGRRRQELALRESEERYRSLVENIDLGITLIDRDYRILMTNAAQGRMFDKPAARFLDRTCYREFEKRGAPCEHCPGVRAMAEGTPQVMETVGVKDDGSRFVVRIHAFPVFDADGVARKFIEVVEDITTRRAAEEALRQSEERFRSIFENAGAGMNTITPEGRFLQVNRAFCRFLGYSAEELRNLAVADVTHPQDLARTRRLFAEAGTGERRSIQYEKRFLHKDGHTVWGNVSSSWVPGPDGRPRYAIGLIQDITQRKLAEQELQKALRETAAARDRIDGILRSVVDGLLVIDEGARLIHCNPAAEDLLGRPLGNSLNRPVGELPLDASLLRQLQTMPPAGGEALECELSLPAGDPDRARVLLARTSPFYDAAEQVVGTVTLLRDVTREREIEQIKSEFVSTAAHELRTPLASVLGYAELLQQSGSQARPEQAEYLEKICEKAEDLSGIVDDLLDLTRIESGRLITLKRARTSLADLLNRIVDQYRLSAPRHRFELRLPAGDPQLGVDREKILQVLENLLSNAVKYSPAGGPIEVAGSVAGGRYRISVRDRGIGMTPEQAERIFDKFYRADGSHTAVRGLGLGMTIVRKIVIAHGGEITVDSAPGAGTTVTFDLPLEPDDFC